ncbi:MAG: IS5 family transposase [Nanoarchaeota archaeon]|nr:IS5 family transposase [Nanoarchaeota archaeon]
MVKTKRWGKKYEDNRNWKKYNERLIKRGEYYLNPRFLETWIDEIKELNHCKVGQPFMYPTSMIEFLAILKAKSFDYRSLEGILKALSKRLGNFPVMSYSQIRRRIKQLKFTFKPKSNHLITGSDGTGMKVSNRGEWIRQKWQVRRGWVKVVILGDVKGNIVDIRIGNEELDENKAHRGMLRANARSIDKNLGDGLYDAKDNFRLYEKLKIEPGLKIRSNASTKAKGCMARKKEVIKYKEQGYKQWAQNVNYGLRWPSTEGIFSAVKTIFGETLSCHKKRNLYHEAKMKFWAYQTIKDVY